MEYRPLTSLWSNHCPSIVGIDPTPILQRLASDRESMHAVASYLNHPHINDLREETAAVLGHHLHAHASHWSALHPHDTKPHPVNVVLFALQKVNIPEETRRTILGGVEKEADLVQHVRRHLARDKWKVETEIPMESSRADLVAFAWKDLERKIIAIELKNNYAACDRLFDQVKDYRTTSDEVRVVLTPQAALECGLAEGTLHEPLKFLARVKQAGASLHVYDATDDRFAIAHSASGDYDRKKWSEMWKKLNEVVTATA